MRTKKQNMHSTFQNFIIYPETRILNTTLKSQAKLSAQTRSALTPNRKAAVFTGSAAGAGAVYYGLDRAADYSVKHFSPLNLKEKLLKASRLSPQESLAVKKAAENYLANSVLKNSGVEIKYLANSVENQNELLEKYEKYRPKKWKRNIPLLVKRFKKQMKENAKAYIEGTNACFNYKEKKVWINEEKLIISVFHELGHAKQYLLKHGNLLKNLIIKGSKLTPYLIFSAILIPTFENKDKDKKLTQLQKTTNIAVKSIPLLYFLSKAPLLANEALASIDGLKDAQNFVESKEILKKMKKAYKMSFTHYLVSVMIPVIILAAVICARQKIQEKLEKHVAACKNQQIH